MNQAILGVRIATCLLGLAAAGVGTAAPVELDPNPSVLMQAMQGHCIVLLGEVHDNAIQHALRAAALRQWMAQGARPALAFEQFDRERQPDIERARRERPADADYLIAQAKGSGDWRWESYRPFVALALAYDLPIVAANLSHGEAMQVANNGWLALFGPATRGALNLDALPTNFRRKHEDAIAIGHCNLVPAATDFDGYVITQRAERPDPCKQLAKHLQPADVIPGRISPTDRQSAGPSISSMP